MSNITFWDKFVPFIHKQQDAKEGPLRTLVDSVENESYILKDQIVSIYDFWDIDKCPNEYLVYLARLLGCKIESCDPALILREQIRNTSYWYKLKGTIEGFRIYMRSLGYNIVIKRLFESSPDGPSIEEDIAITGFNTRLPGYHAASKINVYLERSEFAKDLHLCGDTSGLLTEFFIKRIQQRFEECKPIHLDFYLFFVLNFIDTVTVSDHFQIGIELSDSPTYMCCCYHGKGSHVVNAIYPYFDAGILWDTSVFWDDIVGGDPTRMWDSPMGMPVIWDYQKVWDAGENSDSNYHQWDRPLSLFDFDNGEERSRWDMNYKWDRIELDETKWDSFVLSEDGTELDPYVFYDDIEYEVLYPVCRRDGALSVRRDSWVILDQIGKNWTFDRITGNVYLEDCQLLNREIGLNNCLEIVFDPTIMPFLELPIVQIYSDNYARVRIPTDIVLPLTLSGTGYKIRHIQSIYNTYGLRIYDDGYWKHDYRFLGIKRDCCGKLDDLTIITI